MIEQAWDPYREVSDLPIEDRLTRCQNQLQQWNQTVFGNVNKNLRRKQTHLQQLESLNSLNDNEAEIRELRKEVNEVLTREEIMWKQRSRVEWLQNGDRNTKFFHATASETKVVILDYFKNIFKSDCPTNFGASLDAFEESITPEMNKEFLKEFKPDEVRRALNRMHTTKAPSPNDMPPLFFQKYWDIVGPCVLNCVLQALNLGTMTPHANETYICLVPKTKDPQKITKFRPISLCNVIYKIMSKVLANRLKKILPKVISEVQSAFVLGMLITDNDLVAFETMHTIDQRRKGKGGLMAIKLDMSKAYDRVEWPYLEVIMQRMGFKDKWVSLIMMCVTTVSYFVLINGELRGLSSLRGGCDKGNLFPHIFSSYALKVYLQ